MVLKELEFIMTNGKMHSHEYLELLCLVNTWEISEETQGLEEIRVMLQYTNVISPIDCNVPLRKEQKNAGIELGLLLDKIYCIIHSKEEKIPWNDYITLMECAKKTKQKILPLKNTNKFNESVSEILQITYGITTFISTNRVYKREYINHGVPLYE